MRCRCACAIESFDFHPEQKLARRIASADRIRFRFIVSRILILSDELIFFVATFVEKTIVRIYLGRLNNVLLVQSSEKVKASNWPTSLNGLFLHSLLRCFVYPKYIQTAVGQRQLPLPLQLTIGDVTSDVIIQTFRYTPTTWRCLPLLTVNRRHKSFKLWF